MAAGTIVRKDELTHGRLIFGSPQKEGNLPYQLGRYRNEHRVVVNNIVYIANLIALYQWYHHVRRQFISEDFSEALLTGLRDKLNSAISERVNRLEALCHKMKNDRPARMRGESARPASAKKQRQELVAKWPQLKILFDQFKTVKGDERCRDAFLETVQKGIVKTGRDYITVIQQLLPSDGAFATAWLQGIVDHVVKSALHIIPSFKN